MLLAFVLAALGALLNAHSPVYYNIVLLKDLYHSNFK